MNADHILKTDLLDIIFEKRNKDYGAYILRKGYNSRLYKSLGIAFSIIFIFVLFTFLHKEKMITLKPIEEIFWATPLELPEEKMVAPEPQKPKQSISPSTAEAPKPAVVNDNSGPLVFDDNAPKINDPGNIGPVTPADTDSTSGGGPFIPQAPAVPVITKPIIDRTTPMPSAEVMPSYPGGIKALRRFLEKNITSQATIEPGDMVSVKVKFIVGYDGKLRGFEVVEDGGAQYNNEVIRVLKKMPDWIPGKSNGENVSVYFIVPVKFMPQD